MEHRFSKVLSSSFSTLSLSFVLDGDGFRFWVSRRATTEAHDEWMITDPGVVG